MVTGREKRRRSTFVPVALLISHSIAAEASSTITQRLAPGERHPRPAPANSRERAVLGALSILLLLDVWQPGEFQRLNSLIATSLTGQPGISAYDASHRARYEAGSFVTCPEHVHMFSACQGHWLVLKANRSPSTGR